MLFKNRKSRVNLNLILFSGIVVFVVIGVAAYISLNTSIQKARWVEHTHQVLFNSEKMYAFLKEIESAQRGYIISNNNIYIQNYFKSQDSIFYYLDILKNITTDNSNQQARISSLEKIIDARLERLLFVMRLKESDQTEQIIQLMNLGEGRLRMNEIREIIRYIEQEEQKLLLLRSAAFDTSIKTTQFIVYSIIAFYSVIAILLVNVIRRQLYSEENYTRNLDYLHSEVSCKNEQLSTSNAELLTINQELAAANEKLARNTEDLQVSNEQLFILKEELERRVLERTQQLENKIEQQSETEQALTNALQDLKQRNFELDNYVYKVSHDLRAPLTSMMGLISLIQSENDLAEIKNYANLIGTRVDKMDEFIKSSLNHSRIINVHAQYAVIDVGKIIQDCLDELQYLANREKVKVIMDVQQEVEFVSDQLKMHIILKNLTTNAIKYCNPNATQSFVKFHIRVLKEHAIITIQDNGIGIKEEYIKKVFDMFFRATEKSEGSGLGLYIVKQTIEMLAGTIAIESEYGKGTTFIVTIPNAINK